MLREKLWESCRAKDVFREEKTCVALFSVKARNIESIRHVLYTEIRKIDGKQGTGKRNENSELDFQLPHVQSNVG